MSSRNHLSVASIAWALKTTVTKLEHQFFKSGICGLKQAFLFLLLFVCLFCFLIVRKTYLIVKNNSSALIIFFNLNLRPIFYNFGDGSANTLEDLELDSWTGKGKQQEQPPKSGKSEKSSSPQSLGRVSHKLIVINSNIINKIVCVSCPQHSFHINMFYTIMLKYQ